MAEKSPRSLARALLDAPDRLLAHGPVRGKAIVASVVWTVVVGAYAIGFLGASQARGTTFLDSAFFLVTLVLPLILIWIAALLAEELLRQRELMTSLSALIEPALARAAAEGGGAPTTAGADDRRALAEVEAGMVRLVAGQAQIATALETLLLRASEARVEPVVAVPAAEAVVEAPRPSRRVRAQAAPPSPPPPPAAQPELPMLAEAEPEAGLDWDDLMRALDFPRDADDVEGFRALRLALRRHSLAQMLQAAEDVLTLLAQEGIYIDDLAFRPADPEAWRRFVAGGRGAAVAGMGAVEDPAALEAARAMMKADPIFRDTGLFFQRRFDAVLVEIASDASDEAFAQIADTRSGRAFQLMAGASGSFE